MSNQMTLGTGFEKYSKTTRRKKFLTEMDPIVPRGELCALKVILTNQHLSPARHLYFRQGRGSQKGTFAELKSDNQLDYLPIRTWVSNQIYLLSVLLAHNLGRERQMIAHPPSR